MSTYDGQTQVRMGLVFGELNTLALAYTYSKGAETKDTRATTKEMRDALK